MALNHKGRMALISGANKGIGFEAARQLGTQGATVFLGARNPHLGKVAEEKLKAKGAGKNTATRYLFTVRSVHALQ